MPTASTGSPVTSSLRPKPIMMWPLRFGADCLRPVRDDASVNSCGNQVGAGWGDRHRSSRTPGPPLD
eukprot:6264497-Pyramimonas_sp.AAC.1